MIQLMQNLASPANHYIAERGELHALSCPCSQVDPQRALHFGNPLGDGRLRPIERTGNGFDLLQICQGNQDTQIGRESCRERVCQYVLTVVVGVTLKKKEKKK